MKRSEINRYVKEAAAFLEENHFYLPPWCKWTPSDWATKGAECDEIRNNALGWDVTDFGKGNFEKEGLTLVTIRNGNLNKDKKPYCEKIMVVREGQVTPTHFHWTKMEDIINRGGGTLCVKLWKANKEEQPTDEDVCIQVDGVTRTFKAGSVIRLQPGESISFVPYIYHIFWSENGWSLIGEVSTVNDDANDNRFLDQLPRYPAIEEDEAPEFLLCNEYDKLF